MTTTIDEVILAAMPSRTFGIELHWRSDGARHSPILKNRPQGRYHQLSSGSAWVWSLCDGQHTVATIAEHIAARGGPSDTAKIVASVRRLAIYGLVEGVEIPPPSRSAENRNLAAACRRLLTWRVASNRADGPLAWVYRHVGFLAFTLPARILFFALIVFGLIAFLAAWYARPDPLAALSGHWLWFLPLFYYGCTLLHEMGHALTTKHFGREVIGVGLGWFWVGPFFFVDTSDMWLAGRRERILVCLAGAISDLVMAALCMIVVLIAAPPAAAMALAMAATLYLIVLGNMSPLLEYDGYYALADLLNRPNLRQQSFGHLFGVLRQRPIPWSELGRDRIASTYAVGSLLYMGFVAVTGVRFNHALFGSLFRDVPGRWPDVLAWAIALSLLAIFLTGLVGDIGGLARRPAIPDQGK